MLKGPLVLQVASASDICRPQLGGRKEGKDGYCLALLIKVSWVLQCLLRSCPCLHPQCSKSAVRLHRLEAWDGSAQQTLPPITLVHLSLCSLRHHAHCLIATMLTTPVAWTLHAACHHRPVHYISNYTIYIAPQALRTTSLALQLTLHCPVLVLCFAWHYVQPVRLPVCSASVSARVLSRNTPLALQAE